MSTVKEIQTIYDATIRALNQRALMSAFDSLGKLMSESKIYLFQDEAAGLQETYKRLLHYYTEGYNDPMRRRIYCELLVSAYELTDKIAHHIIGKISSHFYFSTQRTIAIAPEKISQLTDTAITAYETGNIQGAELATNQLFKQIWSSRYLTEEEAESLHQTLHSEAQYSDHEQTSLIINCQIVSSLTLGLQALFDKRKMYLLIIAAENRHEKVKIRAFTGILITLYTYRDRTEYYPELKRYLDTLSEMPDFRKIVQMIIMRFILARDTEKISNKMKDEIIPEMMKLNPKLSLKDVTPESLEEGMNPEWMEQFMDSPLGKKLEEFNKLQEEGSDVMHSSFIHLKSFPFFNEIGHWFMPFITGAPAVDGESALIKSFELFSQIGIMCNSDMYSLYFSMKQIPDESRQMMVTQIESQLSELEKQQLAELQTRDNQIERFVGQYVQDLYRFFKLYPRRDEFNDIFTHPLDFHNLPILQDYFSDENVLMHIADLYLQKNHFEDAFVLYQRLSGDAEKEEAMFQKKGYCKQMTGDYLNALGEYTKAELINPGSKWLLRRMAQCYRAIKKPEKALEYYLQSEKSDANNLSLLLNIGSCYLEMKNYAEALKYYFKVDYLDAHGSKAWRPVAWCSFLIGKYDQARNYYDKLLAYSPDYQDYMNAGHTAWALQNIKEAVAFYKKSAQSLNGDYSQFQAEFNRDAPELIAAGIDPAEIPLVLDFIHGSTSD